MSRTAAADDGGRYEYIDASQTQQRPSASNNSTPNSRKRNGV
jgi:hypothetical protein